MAAKYSYTSNYALIDLLVSPHHLWNSSSHICRKNAGDVLTQCLAMQDFFGAIVALQNGEDLKKKCFIGRMKKHTIEFIMNRIPDNLIGRVAESILGYFPEELRLAYFGEVILKTAVRSQAARFLLCRLAIHQVNYFEDPSFLKVSDVSYSGLKGLHCEVYQLLIETQTMLSYPLCQIATVLNVKMDSLIDFQGKILNFNREWDYETPLTEFWSLIKGSNNKFRNHEIYQSLSRLKACESVLVGMEKNLCSAIEKPDRSQWCVVRDSLGRLQGIVNYEHSGSCTDLYYLYSGHWNGNLPIRNDKACYSGIGTLLFEEVIASSLYFRGREFMIELISRPDASSFYKKIGCSENEERDLYTFNRSAICHFLADRAGRIAPFCKGLTRS